MKEFVKISRKFDSHVVFMRAELASAKNMLPNGLD